jgi:DHA2 family multidrug resistance protein
MAGGADILHQYRPALVTVLALKFIRVDLPNLSMLKKIDYLHLVSGRLLGGLEFVLDQQRSELQDTHIAIAGWASLVVLFLLERSFNLAG